MNLIKKDLLIIGSGLAGKLSALLINQKFQQNIDIMIITKHLESNSMLAQGGIAISIDNDDIESHIQDTMRAGKFKNNLSNVTEIIQSSANCISILNELGFDFHKEAGEYVKRLEAGHSRNRVYYNTDRTGFEIMKCVNRNIEEQGIEILNNQFTIKLINDNGKCAGAIVYDLEKDEYNVVIAKNVIIASGGLSGLFTRRTGIKQNIGDGIALANSIGAKVSGLNLIQFHPTAYFNENDNSTFLVTEAIRGEGAKLKNEDNEYFLKGNVENEELAPRDVLSEAIYKEIYINKKKVYLDCSNVNEIQSKFPSIYEYFMKIGIDFCKTAIPIYPAAHYLCGGIDIDTHSRTNIDGLYAIGEVANTGLHGANRLASNSLMEIIVLAQNLTDIINIDKKYNDDIFQSEKRIEVFDIKKESTDIIVNEFNQNFNVLKNREGLEKIFEEIEKLNKKELKVNDNIDINLVKEHFIIENIQSIIKEELKK